MAAEIRISALNELIQALSTADFIPIVHSADNTTYKYKIGNYVVKNSGNETIAGVKTFSSSPIVPTPTTDMQASTKKYVDDFAATLGTSSVLNAGVANGGATLDSSGYLATAQIPPITITDTYVVSSELAMLALTCQRGDVAVRSDINNTFILKGSNPATLTDWQMLPTPTDLVLSVDGQTGAVDLSGVYVSNYRPAKTYAQYEACFYLGVPYKSLSAGNSGHQPDTSPTYWEVTGGGAGTTSSFGYTFKNGTLDATIDGFVPYMNTTPAVTPEVSPAGTIPTGFGIAWNGTNTIIGKGDLILTKPAISCYGAGFYHDFHIDRGCLGTITKLLFRFMTSANYVDGYLQMFILDKTNSNFIPITNSLPATYASISDWLTTFIPSTATEYRLYIHCATSTMTTWTAEFGGFELGRRDLTIGAAIGKWTPYTPSVLGGITIGNGSIQFFWKQDGEDCLIRAHFVFGSTTVVSSIITASLPSVLSPDIASISPYEKVGSWSGFDSSASVHTQEYAVDLGGGTILRMLSTATSLPFAWASGDELSVYDVRIKNTQWTSNVNLASDFTEYAFNTTASPTLGTKITTNFGTGIGGTLIPTMSSSGITSNDWQLQVQFQKGIQISDQLILEFSADGKKWFDAEKKFPYLAINSARYGCKVKQDPADLLNQATVYFGCSGPDQSTATTYASVSTAWATAMAGYYYRVRKVSNGNMAEIRNDFMTTVGGERIHNKIVYGTTASVAGGSVAVAHGLDATKILGIRTSVMFATTSGAMSENTDSVFGAVRFHERWDVNNVTITNDSSQSGSIYSKPFRTVIEYIE